MGKPLYEQDFFRWAEQQGFAAPLNPSYITR